jgi:hypothetical protein
VLNKYNELCDIFETAIDKEKIEKHNSIDKDIYMQSKALYFEKIRANH